MAEAKVVRRTKTADQITEQQIRLNNAIAREIHAISTQYPNGNLPASAEARLRTLGQRGARVTDAYIRMINRK